MTTLDHFIDALDTPNQEIATRLRRLIDDALPNAEGRIYHGHPVWLNEKSPVAGFKPFPRWTTFMIWNAAPIEDASGALVAGPRMSTVKYAAPEEIDHGLVAGWLTQATA